MRKKYGKMSGISLRTIHFIGISISFIFSLFLLITIYLLANSYHDVNDSTLEYTTWEDNAEELAKASDYLTENVRLFVINKDKEYLDNYFNEINVTKRRDNAIECLKEKLENTEAFNKLNLAMNESNELTKLEYHAMRLIVDIESFDLSLFPDEIKNYQIPSSEESLSNDEKENIAINLVFGNDYKDSKTIISSSVNDCLDELNTMMVNKINQSTSSLRRILIFQQVVIFLLIASLIFFFAISYINVVNPLNEGINSIINDDLLKIHGIKEYRYFAEKYNDMRLKENMHNVELEYEAEHDKLTGLLNRAGYDLVCKDLNMDSLTYILIDIDVFKTINDKYGHQIGDLVIKRAADTLQNNFGQHIISRIGGDEFAIIIENSDNNIMNEISSKVKDINTNLIKPINNIPGVTLSFGVASGSNTDSISSLAVKADKALYETKRKGRANVTFYDFDINY